MILKLDIISSLRIKISFPNQDPLIASIPVDTFTTNLTVARRNKRDYSLSDFNLLDGRYERGKDDGTEPSLCGEIVLMVSFISKHVVMYL